MDGQGRAKLNIQHTISDKRNYVTFENITCLYTYECRSTEKQTNRTSFKGKQYQTGNNRNHGSKTKNRSFKMKPPEFSIEGNTDYNVFDRNIDNDVGRGMMLYVHKLLPAKEVNIEIDLQKYL